MLCLKARLWSASKKPSKLTMITKRYFTYPCWDRKDMENQNDFDTCLISSHRNSTSGKQMCRPRMFVIFVHITSTSQKKDSSATDVYSLCLHFIRGHSNSNFILDEVPFFPNSSKYMLWNVLCGKISLYIEIILIFMMTN